MTCFICESCGVQYGDSDAPPEVCAICTDDRQHVGWDGQRWTTHDQLAATHHVRIEADGRFNGIGVTERFAIPQRALLVPTGEGNVLWDCTSLVTPAAIEEIERLGGIDMIAISHPHFYASMVEWSDAFGGIPILLHRDDQAWIQRPSQHITTWTGDRYELFPGAALLHLPGHFPGSNALLWTDPHNGRRALLAGDTLHVAGDRRHISVMHSVPNHVPVGPGTIREVRRRLAGVDFDDLYGFTWGLNIIGAARRAVEDSLDRYLAAIGGDRSVS